MSFKQCAAGQRLIAASDVKGLGDSMIILETARLTIRHLEPKDLSALFALYRDPEVRQYFPDGVLSLEETKQEIEWHLSGHPDFPQLGLWATVERSSGAFLGRCGLLPWDIEGKSEVELAYLIDKRHCGAGFATEAAQAIVGYARKVLNRKRLISLILPGNLASARVAVKAGMSFERELHIEVGPCHVYSCSLGPDD